MRFSLIRLSHTVPSLVVAAALLTPTEAIAHASKPLKCQASVSNSRPSDDSTTTVIVETAANARVSTSALYKTTTDTQAARANAKGLAVTSYDVSDATPGFRVKVSVLVQLGNHQGQCLTSYVPQ